MRDRYGCVVRRPRRLKKALRKVDEGLSVRRTPARDRLYGRCLRWGRGRLRLFDAERLLSREDGSKP